VSAHLLAETEGSLDRLGLDRERGEDGFDS